MKVTSAARASLLFLIGGSIVLASMTASAQSIRDQLTALSDGLNDIDPIIRLVTYEEAVLSENATIRRVALRTALQSTDSDLRTLALRGALKGRETISFKLSRSPGYQKALDDAANSEQKMKKVERTYVHHQRVLGAYSWTLPLRVMEYDYATGAISGACMSGLAAPNDSYTFRGSVSGDEITLTLACYAGGYSACSLNAELEDEGKVVGRLSCPNNASAVVTLDLL